MQEQQMQMQMQMQQMQMQQMQQMQPQQVVQMNAPTLVPAPASPNINIQLQQSTGALLGSPGSTMSPGRSIAETLREAVAKARSTLDNLNDNAKETKAMEFESLIVEEQKEFEPVEAQATEILEYLKPPDMSDLISKTSRPGELTRYTSLFQTLSGAC